MTTLRVLAVTAASGRVSYVFFEGGRLRDWRVSDTAARSPEHAVGHFQDWINTLRPNVVVTKKLAASHTNEDKPKRIISAIARTAAQNYVLDVSVVPQQNYENKYDEAVALGERFPEIRAWIPKRRRFFEKEPRNIVLFEALALALTVMQDPSTTIASAMS